MPSDRDIFFSNESFLIGVLQAVSGGSLVAAIAQFQSLKAFGGLLVVTLFMTLMTISLAAAVLAAFCKYEYKKWDIKAGVSARQGNAQEAAERGASSSFHLDWMRRTMKIAVVSIVAGLGVLIVGFWIFAYRAA